MAYTDTAYALCRAVFGATTTDLPDATLALFLTEVESDLILMYPCTGSGSTHSVTGTDETYFATALGYALAAMVNCLPLGSGLAGNSTKVKVGPVEQTFQTANGTTYDAKLMALAQKNMNKIACVRSNAVAANVGGKGLFILTGRQRMTGDPNTLYDLALGKGAKSVTSTPENSNDTTVTDIDYTE